VFGCNKLLVMEQNVAEKLDEIALAKIKLDEIAFAQIEYSEACKAYFHGVEIGYTMVKHFATVNALLVVVIGYLATMEVKNAFLPSPTDLARLVPWLGIFFSLGLGALVPHYWKHVSNCRDRCSEIEDKFGGRLFSRLKEIEVGNQRSTFGASAGLAAFILLPALLWGAFAFRKQIGNIPIFQGLVG
jgi:hypothetical protein